MPSTRSHVQAGSIILVGLFLQLLVPYVTFGKDTIDGHFGLIPFPDYQESETIKRPLAPTPFEIQKCCKRPSITNHDSLPSITFSREKSAFELWEQQEWERKQEEKRQKNAITEAYAKKARAVAEQQLALHNYEQKRRNEAQHSLNSLTSKIPSLIEQTAAFNEYSKQQWPYAIDRLDYLKKYTNDPDYWEHKKYHLSHESTDLLRDQKIDVKEYEQLYGNHLQHGIHTEHVAIISHAAKLQTQTKSSSDTLQVCSFVVLAINASHGTNIKGDFIKSLEINDVCFHILNPTHYAYLAGQLAKIQSHIELDASTDWQKAFEYLHKASEHDKALNACLNATQKYTSQFKKANPDYTFHVLKIMSEMSLNAFADLPLQKQFELLETHHEAIAIKALRSLHAEAGTEALLMQYAAQILHLDNPQLLHNQNLIKTVLDPVDSLERSKAITNTPYHSTTQMPFVNDQGILKEHALIVEAHNMQLPPKHTLQKLNLVNPTYDLLHIYCTTKNSEDQDCASYGIFHALQATQSLTQTVTKAHASFAQQYHGALVHQQNNELILWSNDLACEYQNAQQQQVHQELVWLTHSYLETANKQINNKNDVTQRLLDDIEEKLLLAHHYNQQSEPVKSHALIENITGIFGTINKAGQRAPYIYQPLNLNGSIGNISNSIAHTIQHIKQVNKTSCDIEEKIKYATHELSNLSIQSGRLKRDFSQLTQQDAQDYVERKALCYSRSNKQKAIKNKLHAQGSNNFDKNFPQAKHVLSPNEYVRARQQHAQIYYHSCIQDAREKQKHSLDSITTRIDSDIPSVKASEIIGFTIKPTANTIEISPAPEDIIENCKEFWPSEEIVEDIVDLWNQEIPLYSIGSQEAAYKRYADRYDAYQETKDNPYIFVERSYVISNEAQQLLNTKNINTTHLKSGTYNPLQHQLHTELLDILEQTTALDAHDSFPDILKPTNALVLDYVSTAAHINQYGDVIKVMTLADFCWGTLDCGQGVLEGIINGAINVGTYMDEHPMETLFFAVAGKYTLYYQIAKLVYELGNVAIDYYSTPATKDNKPQTIEFRDIVKAASSFGTQMYLNQKLTQHLSKELSPAQHALDEWIAENVWPPHTAPKTAEAVLTNNETIRISTNANNSSVNLHKTSSSNQSLKSTQAINGLSKEEIQKSRFERAANRRTKKIKASQKPIPTQARKIKEIMADQKAEKHIFSEDHVNNGILQLGKNRRKIRNFVTDKIFEAYKKGKLINGPNQIHTMVNGLDCTIRVFVENGSIKFFNAMPGHATRSLGNTFHI